jgi:hypothetical protein
MIDTSRRRRDPTTLTIQDLGALGELLGSVAVLATLIYLALQMRQNTMAIGAQLDASLITYVGWQHQQAGRGLLPSFYGTGATV